VPIRRTNAQKIQARQLTHAEQVRAFRASLNEDFTDNTFGVAFESRRHAERAWPACRAAVWRGSHRMRIPCAAEQFDGLTRRGAELLWSVWNRDTFPLADVLAAINADRDSVSAFERREPKAAAALGRYLDQWREDLDTIERLARDLDDSKVPVWRRRFPKELNTGATYDDPRPKIFGLRGDADA
jgi:hypothetical protein